MSQKENFTERQKIEEMYHDNRADIKIRSKGSRPDLSEQYKYFWKLVGDVQGKKILDFGCGNGWVSVMYAQQGAEVWGFDISGELIEKARKSVQEKGLGDRIILEKMAAENLSFDDNFFDLVVGSAILHHTELDVTLRHVARVLKPDGKAIFIEPMNQNLFLRIWRKMTPGRRSPSERALTNPDLELIKELFPDAKMFYFGFFSIFTEGLLIFFPRSRFVDALNTSLAKFDHQLFNMLPSLGNFGSVVVLDLKK